MYVVRLCSLMVIMTKKKNIQTEITTIMNNKTPLVDSNSTCHGNNTISVGSMR